MIKMKENYEYIITKVEEAKHRAGRVSEEVRIMAVTKTKSIDIVKSAYSAGFRLFGGKPCSGSS